MTDITLTFIFVLGMGLINSVTVVVWPTQPLNLVTMLEKYSIRDPFAACLFAENPVAAIMF